MFRSVSSVDVEADGFSRVPVDARCAGSAPVASASSGADERSADLGFDAPSLDEALGLVFRSGLAARVARSFADGLDAGRANAPRALILPLRRHGLRSPIARPGLSCAGAGGGGPGILAA